jgi:OTU domain-containing protein 5
MREIYNFPIEIYAYSSLPMKTFHEEPGENQVIRLSYHGKSHYNSVVPLNWTPSQSLLDSDKAGLIEQEALDYSLEN